MVASPQLVEPQCARKRITPIALLPAFLLCLGWLSFIAQAYDCWASAMDDFCTMTTEPGKVLGGEELATQLEIMRRAWRPKDL